jgi:phosphatidylserine/phosphatidylglycerophosphate/cardiolipin synthase-like enzyme
MLESLRARGFTQAEARRFMLSAMASGKPLTRVPAHVPATILDGKTLAAALPAPTTLVATQPEQLVSAMSTLDAFRFVIAASDTHLRIASPFIEADGLKPIAPWLRAAAQRGVELVLLNRDPGGSPSAPLAHDALSRLFGPRFRVASYHVTADRRQLLSLHAKLLIADESVAYVGSAEIRRHSLELNFELGVLVCGSSVPGLVRLFDAIAKLRAAQ